MNHVLTTPPPPPPPCSWQQKDPLETESQPQKKHEEEDEESQLRKMYEKEDREYNPFLEPYSDEENDTSPPIEKPFATFDTDEDEYFGTYDKDLWRKYRDQVERSEGFDITDCPGGCFMITVFPMPNYLSSPKNYHKLEDYAGKALKEYNKREATSYEVDKLLYVNGGGCRDFIYYITFSVKNGEHRYFQAKVVEDIDMSLDFPLTRPRPDQNLNVEAVVE